MRKQRGTIRDNWKQIMKIILYTLYSSTSPFVFPSSSSVAEQGAKHVLVLNYEGERVMLLWLKLDLKMVKWDFNWSDLESEWMKEIAVSLIVDDGSSQSIMLKWDGFDDVWIILFGLISLKRNKFVQYVQLRSSG